MSGMPVFERDLSAVAITKTPKAIEEEHKFNFLEFRTSNAPPMTEKELMALRDNEYTHAAAAHLDDETVAANAERILREAMAKSEAERDEHIRARKKERKVRYVMPDSDPLIKACKKGDYEKVSELIADQEPEEVMEYVNGRDKNGSTPIFHTVWLGHLEALRILLDHGANPNVQNNRQNTALHLACEREHSDLILTLIQYGASISLVNVTGQMCYQTLSTKEACAKMENFAKRCYNEKRRGTRGSEAFKLTVPTKREAFWSTSYYKKDYYSANSEAVSTITQTLPRSSELRKAVESVESNRAKVTNETGTPDVNKFFKKFLHRKLKNYESPADILQRQAAIRAERQLQYELKQMQRLADERAASETVDDDEKLENLPPLASRKRRKSTGDINAASKSTPILHAILRSLSLYADITPEHKQLVEFLCLMHPTRLPLPPVLHQMPDWLEEYIEVKRAIEEQAQLELQWEEQQREQQQFEVEEQARSLANTTSAEASTHRPRTRESHEYALTRLRTAAFASAASELLNARMFSVSKTVIPHSHKPELVRPVVSLLKDLTVHLPVSPVKLPRAMSASASNASLRSNTSPVRPHTSAGGGSVNSPPPIVDPINLQLDREQESDFRKNPRYGNWVLKQVSVLNEIMASNPNIHYTRPGGYKDTVPHDPVIAAHAQDDSTMLVDGDLTGLIDTEVEKLLRNKYGPTSVATQKALQEIDAHERLEKIPRGSTIAHASTIESISTTSLGHTVPGASTIQLGALAKEFLHEERKAYVKNLYAQVHSVLCTIKKSQALYIPPVLAKRLRALNPSLLAELGPSAGGLNSGGLRKEYATLAIHPAHPERTAMMFEQQVRRMIEERKRERELAFMEQKEQEMSNHDAALPSRRISTASSHSNSRTTSFQTPPRPSTAAVYSTPGSSTMNRSASASKLGSVNRLRVSPSSPSLLANYPGSPVAAAQAAAVASEKALNATALQRALIQQYNPRVLSPFMGGGSYERTPGSVQKEFRLNSSVLRNDHSAQSPTIQQSQEEGDVQIMQVDYNTHRSALASRSGGRPYTASSNDRPSTGLDRAFTELSLAKQSLQVEDGWSVNPIVTNPAQVRSPTRAMSASASRTSLASSASHSQLYATFNPTARPNSTLAPRPGTSGSPAATAQVIASAAAQLRPSASATKLLSPNSASKSASSSNLFGAIYTGADRSALLATHNPSSMSSKIMNLEPVQASPIRVLNKSASGSSLLQQIKPHNSPKPFTPAGLVTHGKAGVLTSSTPSRSHLPTKEEEKEVYVASNNSIALTLPSPSRGSSFTSDTREIAKSLGGISGSRAPMQLKIGYAAAAAAAAATEQFTSALTPTKHPSGMEVGSNLQPTISSPPSRAMVNKAAAIAKRSGHEERAAARQMENVSEALQSSAFPPSSYFGSEDQPHQQQQQLGLDPDWNPHPTLASGSTNSSSMGGYIFTPAAYGSNRAQSAAARARTDPNFLYSAHTKEQNPIVATTTGKHERSRSASKHRNPSIGSWDGDVETERSAGDAARIVQNAASFVSFVRPEPSIGLMANRQTQ